MDKHKEKPMYKIASQNQDYAHLQESENEKKFGLKLQLKYWYEFTLSLVKKMKYDFYSCLQEIVMAREKYQIDIDPLNLLVQIQTKIFNKYEDILIDHIPNYHLNQKLSAKQQRVSQDQKFSSQEKQRPFIQFPQQVIETQLKNGFTFSQIKGTQTQQTLIGQKHNQFQIQEEVQQDQSGNQQSKQQSQKLNHQNRQLQLILRQKQLQKKLQQSLTQLQMTKNILEQKQSHFILREKQLLSLIKNLEKQSISQNRQQKMKNLKDRIQKDSFIRQLGFQKQRNNLQFLIMKQNIDSNVIASNFIFNPGVGSQTFRKDHRKYGFGVSQKTQF